MTFNLVEPRRTKTTSGFDVVTAGTEGVTLIITPPVVDPVCGDVNPAGGGDGDVDILDTLRVLNMSVGLVVPTPKEKIAADVQPDNDPDPHGDGDVDVLDALRILKAAVGPATITSCGGPKL